MNTLIFMFVLALTLAICLLIVLLITYKLLKAKDEPKQPDEIEKFLIWLNEDYQIIHGDPNIGTQIYLRRIHDDYMRYYADGKRETT